MDAKKRMLQQLEQDKLERFGKKGASGQVEATSTQ